MPVNKNALIRYRVIDGCLTGKDNGEEEYNTLEYITRKIADQLDFDISASMFHKDIQNLKKIYGAPIKFDRTRNRYCYTDPDFSIKEFPLTHDEIKALDFSTVLLQQLKDTKMFNQFENAINKIIEGFRISASIGKSEKQIMQVEEPLRTEGNILLDTLLDAILFKKCIAVNYNAFGKEAKDHDYSPYLLKEYRNRWYTIGYSERAKNIVTFGLDRIKSIKASQLKYKNDPDFIPEDFFKYSLGIIQRHEKKPYKIILSFNAEQAPYIISQPLHHSQNILLETEKEVQIELHLYITQELKMTILSYGSDVMVLKPEILKKEIKQIIKKMGSLYK